MIVLNTIVADQLNKFKTDLDDRLAKGEKKELAMPPTGAYRIFGRRQTRWGCMCSPNRG